MGAVLPEPETIKSPISVLRLITTPSNGARRNLKSSKACNRWTASASEALVCMLRNPKPSLFSRLALEIPDPFRPKGLLARRVGNERERCLQDRERTARPNLQEINAGKKSSLFPWESSRILGHP
jgi:hypothetical protein